MPRCPLRFFVTPGPLARLLAAFFALAPGDAWADDTRSPARPDRPNVVIIVADDLGWNDVGFHGSEIKTPRLDALARESVVLNQFYVFPTCSPTRAALLTGRSPSRFRILGPLGLDPSRSLPLETVTLAEVLADAGYATGLAGKWHLGPTFEFGPRRQGFQVASGYLHGQIDQYEHHYKNLQPSWFRDESFANESGHATDLLARDACDFIERQRARPFFLYVAFSVPHCPLQEDDRWVRQYDGVIEHPHRRLFAGMVSHMDDAIGRVVDKLDALGLRERTLVWFTSDNGGQRDLGQADYGGKHGPYERLGDNRPLRGWKGELYEGGIRVPSLVNWRGTLPPRRANEVISAIDVAPTVADQCGAAMPATPQLDGMNVWPAIASNERLRERTLFWTTGQQSAVRAGNWKLVETTKSTQLELFDIAADANEVRDRAATERERVESLAAKLAALKTELSKP